MHPLSEGVTIGLVLDNQVGPVLHREHSRVSPLGQSGANHKGPDPGDLLGQDSTISAAERRRVLVILSVDRELIHHSHS